MGVVCPTCGDEGWDNALVYCVRCLKEAVHRYCLDKVPETYDKINEYVRWVCDDCEAESHKSVHSTSDAKTQGKTRSEEIEVDSVVTLKKKRISHLTEKVDSGHCTNGSVLQPPHKEIDCSKDPEIISHYRPSRARTNSKDDCSRMVLVENEPISPIKSSQLHEAKKVEVMANGTPSRAKMRKLNDFSILVTTNQSQSADSVEFDEDAPLASLSLLSPNLKNSLHNSAEKRCENIPTLQHHSEGNDTGDAGEADRIVEPSLASCKTNKADIFAEQRCENISTLQPHLEENGSNHEKDSEPTADLSLVSCNKNDADTISQPLTTTQPIVAEGEKLVQAKPLRDPIWRGKFHILNQGDTVEGLAAHLSSKACRMVYTEGSLLPETLHLQIHPRAAVWPKTFKKSAPTDDNIAMYILPKNTRYARSFDSLVTKLTEQNLALKCSTQNAELLIFTSTELPPPYSKFRNKCYLWGVFRAKPSLSSCATK